MQNSIDNFLEKYGKYIGHIANFIAVGAAIVSLYNWLNPIVGFWQIISIILFIGLLLSMYHSRQLKLKIMKLNQSLKLSNESTSKLMLSISEHTVADIKANGGLIPITEMASLLNTVKNVNTSMEISPGSCFLDEIEDLRNSMTGNHHFHLEAIFTILVDVFIYLFHLDFGCFLV